MPAAIRAGAVYFALVFAIGFGLGAIRTLAVAPRVGALAAVALELPVMLASAWFVCRRVTTRFGVAADSAARLAMGGTAFALLMLAEFVLAVLGFGVSPTAYLAGFTRAAAILGVAGQLAFAAIPRLQRRG